MKKLIAGMLTGIIIGILLMMPVEVDAKGISDNATANATRPVGFFESTTDLRAWVRDTGIHKGEYIKGEHDCEDFAMELWWEAWQENRPVGLYIKEVWRDGERTQLHVKNFSIIGDFLDGQGYVKQIEPQTRRVGPLGGYNIKLD